MFRGAALPLALFLMVMVVVVVVGPSLAAPPLPPSLSQQDLTMSVIVNQLAILQGLNASISFFASHGDELKQLREDMENEWQVMNETLVGMKNEIQRLNETGESRGRAMNEMNDDMQSMSRNIQREMSDFGEQMKTEINNKADAINMQINEMNTKINVANDNVQRWMNETNEKRTDGTQIVMERLEAVQNAVATYHLRPDRSDLHTLHNDTADSLCSGDKVLYGGEGALEVTDSENYTNNLHCSWTVTLPEGSRPVFRWHYFNLESCCDYVRVVTDVDHNKYYDYNGSNPPDGSFLTVMNNKFKVIFYTDGSVTGRGFKLQYRAVSRD